MAIKEIPINYRVYYKNIKNKYTQLKENAINKITELNKVIAESYESILNNINVYKDNFGIDLSNYVEFRNNEYIDGTFYKIAKGLFINRKNNYVIVSDLFDLYNLANKQREINKIQAEIKEYDKILALSLNQYKTLLSVFYNKVHERMILNGNGYVFESNIGWTCINRCHIEKRKPHIDYAATKKKKAELLAQGIKIYNAEEANWCKQNDIEYNAADPRVYLKNEYCYEISLLGCKLPNGSKYKLEITDFRGREIRGFSNNELAEKANNNTITICKYPLDLRTKLAICESIDKMLYINLIRNENQKPINITATDRKNRQ